MPGGWFNAVTGSILDNIGICFNDQLGITECENNNVKYSPEMLLVYSDPEEAKDIIDEIYEDCDADCI